MAEHEFEKLLGAFAADTLTPEERQQLYQAALRDQQLFDALADEQALKELLTDPAVRRRLLQALNETSPATGGSTASWLDWFRRPANLALAGGLATAVFAVILGTKIYQDSLKQAGRSVATEDAKPAAPPAPTPAATPPALSRPIEPNTNALEAPGPTAAKKDGLTDKPATSDRIAQSQASRAADATLEYAPERIRRDDDRKQAEAPLATAGHERDVSARTDQPPAAGSPAAAPEPKKSLAPAGASLPESGSSTAGARALFYGEAVRADTGGIAPSQERALKPSAESDSQANAFKRKLEGLSQLSKAASPAAPVKPLGLRYSFVTQTADGQEQEIDEAAASKSSTPVRLTIEANQDGYIQVWQHVGSADTQLLLPQKDSGHISLKVSAGQRQRLPLPADHGTVILRLARVPFGPISRQEAALLNRLYPSQLRESVAGTGSQEQAIFVVSRDFAPTAQIAVDILPAQQ